MIFSCFGWGQTFAVMLLICPQSFQIPSGHMCFRIHIFTLWTGKIGHMRDVMKHLHRIWGNPFNQTHGHSLGKINKIHEVVWIKIITISGRFTLGFTIKWIMGPNWEREEKQLHFQSFLGKDCGPVTSLASCSPLICSCAWASLGGDTISHHRRAYISPGSGSPAVTVLSMRTPWEMNTEIMTIIYFS